MQRTDKKFFATNTDRDYQTKKEPPTPASAMKSSEKMKVFRVASSLSIVNNMKSISARGSNRDLVAYQAAQAKKKAAKK